MMWGARGESMEAQFLDQGSAHGVLDAGWSGKAKKHFLSRLFVCITGDHAWAWACDQCASGGMESFLSSKATVGPEHG